MSLPLPGYRESRLLRSSGQARVYEAIRGDGQAVVAKVFELGTADLDARIEHEFAQIGDLAIPGVARTLGLQRTGDRLVLLLERHPGVPLASYAEGRPLALERFTGIALELAEILARVHALGLVHGDIEPRAITIDPVGRQVSLGALGIPVLLELERRHIYDPAVLEGMLPYISPEQTGRTGRPVDSRSDLYSLGVTFYELLTGRRPFTQTSPLELIHAHLARLPEPPQRLRAELPDALARIVLELLAKAPEQRYQTATGLAADLRRVEDLLRAGSSTDTLELRRDDVPPELHLPHQLYGREQERRELADELAQVQREGEVKVVLVTGPAGIGKSALLTDFEAEAARLGCYVARGRFTPEQLRPYAGFVEAFTELVDQLLTESEARLEHWRERLAAALGGIGRIVTELLPSLELVLGKQPEVAALEPDLARNRIHLALARFLSAFRIEGPPLVLVLEDLQWADHSSLALLEVLTEGARPGAMLVLGSVRCEAIDDHHPLRGLIERLPSPRLRTLDLTPLARAAIVALLADTLARAPAELAELAAIVARKTESNPLYVRQLLGQLADAGILRHGERGWTWDAAAIEAIELPEGLLAVMQAKLGKLGAEARDLLQRAACIGERFDLGSLLAVGERSRLELTKIVYELVEAGLLAHVGGELRFTHHGIREAALAEVGPGRRGLRWPIGQHLLARSDADERLFEIVDHLDAGLARVEPIEPAQRVELAELNLRAGRRALDSAAYEAALRYLEQGIALVGEQRDALARSGPAAPDYALVVELCFARAQLFGVSGRFEAARSAFEELLGWPLAERDYGRIAARWIARQQLAGRTKDALEFGLGALERCGFARPRPRSRAAVRRQLGRLWQSVRVLELADLVALPSCADESAAAALELLGPLKTATYLVNRDLYLALVGEHVRAVLRHGNHPSAALALAQFAIVLAAMLDEVEGAIRTCDHAIALAERFAPRPTRVRTAAYAHLFVSPLGRPFAEPLERLDALQAEALEIGDLLWAGYTGALALSMRLEVGTTLPMLERLSERFANELGARTSREAILLAATLRGFAILLGDERDADTRARALAAIDPEHVQARGGSRYSVHFTTATAALLWQLLGRPADALALCLSIYETLEEVMFGSWVIPRVALTILLAAEQLRRADEALPPDAAAATRWAALLVRRWASGSPASYGHYHEFAGGLRLLARNRRREATLQLERARVHAAQQGCRWVEGLAAEQLAHVAELDGLTGFAEAARRQAIDAYAAWGAGAKLALLQAGRSPAKAHAPAHARAHDPSPERFTGSGALDFDSVLRSVAAISADLRVEQVIARVLDAALGNAGADRGLVVLELDGEQRIVAFAEVDGEPRVLAEPLALAEASELAPTSLIHFVLRTSQALVLDDAAADPRFADDPYIRAVGVQSLLGVPILQARRRLGALVLESRLGRQWFTPQRLEVLRLIAGHAAGVLAQARIHQALRESEARWRSLVRGAPDLIALIDERGAVEFDNRGGAAMALFDDASISESWRGAVADVLERGIVAELEIQAREQGTRRWYVVRIAPIEREGEREGRREAIAIATDITERKQAEAEKQALEGQIRRQQRLESIGTLASGVAHEINNPIQGIMNYAELITDNAGDEELVQEFAGEISKESERVATIVRNLLAFSRQETQAPLELVSPAKLVQPTLSLIHSIIRKDQITLRVNIPAELPPLRCRVQQVQQIIMNLVANARDALNSAYPGYDDRKWIEIGAEALARADPLARRWVRVTVEDCGPGIPADVLPRIFDPFFTTKGRDQGTGLGLAVSHGIAIEHGGELSVENRVGGGARFFLDLPVD